MNVLAAVVLSHGMLEEYRKMVSVGSTLKLQCLTGSDIKWKHNGKPVRQDHKIIYYYLVVPNFTSLDSGNYTCSGKDSHAEFVEDSIVVFAGGKKLVS